MKDELKKKRTKALAAYAQHLLSAPDTLCASLPFHRAWARRRDELEAAARAACKEKP